MISQKKRLLCACTMSLTLLLLACTATAANAAGQTVKVATDPSFVPFESMDLQSREYVGYDIDMIHAIGKHVGFKVDLRPMDFNGIIPAIQAGSVDIAIAAITITDKRAQKVDFSKPYYDSGLKLMVPEDNDSIHTVKDLKGKSVSTKIGSTSYDYLTQKVPGIGKVTPYPGTSQMYMALISGSVDAAFYDVPNVEYFIKTKGKGKVKSVGPIYAGQKYGIVFPKGSDLVKPVNKALAEMKQDGSFAKIYKKWFDKMPPADLTR